jgi:ATP-dependent DNA helicase RecG
MNELLQHILTTPTETEVIEFKEAKRQYDTHKLGEYFSALSNEANLKGLKSAWLVFGVKNDKSIIGTTISDKQLNEYKEEIAKNTSPKIGFIEVKRVDCEEGKVIILEIPAAPTGIPIAWKGHYYGRDGESLSALHLEEIQRIRNQVVQKDWSSEIVKSATIEDLDKDAIAYARKQFVSKNKSLESEIASWDDATFLNKAKITVKGNITNSAILLLGKGESEHFINPALAKISWILRDRDNLEKDYQHFTCPLILEVEKVYGKIRNLKYRYIKDGSLFPEEVDQFDPFIIREALNNCIVHQDYSLGGKINVVEREDGILTFINMGEFIPKDVETVIENDAPESLYRNPFLANAMVNLNMIDTIGSGIKRMFVIQRDKFFPLPDFDFSDNKVKVAITGKVIDTNYAKLLVKQKDSLSLLEVILLDKVQKKQIITDEAAKLLKSKDLIEGRKPQYFVSSKIAEIVNEKAGYIRNRGFKEIHYKNLVLEFLDKYGQASKDDVDKLILDILPEFLDKQQKANKVKNLLYSMSKRDKTIENKGTNRNPIWKKSLSK